MNIIIIIPLILLITFLITQLAKLIKIPPVVALIFSGLILGIPFFKSFVTEQDLNVIFGLGDLGLICLMFLAGLETKASLLKMEFRDAALVAIFAAIIPFLLGFVVFQFLGFSVIISLVVGICMSITAEATKARVLLDLNKLKTKIGTLMMEAGLIDDILGLGIFILITFLFNAVSLKEDILLTGVIFAFFVGVLMQKNGGKNHKVIKIVEKILMIGIVPFFFVSMGIHFELSSLTVDSHILIIILILAFFGKMFGTFLVKPFTKLKWKQLHLIGWAMNSRGALELALALIAFRANLIPVEIYSSLVIMALVTTLTFPFVIRWMIRKTPSLMD